MKTRALILTALFAALTAVGAFLRIPFPIAPITLQVFFTAMAGVLLGPRYGALSQLVYVVLGLIGLPVFTAMIETMKVNSERMAQAASDPGLMATDLAEVLVRKGVPFRHAHHKVGALVRFAAEHGKALNEVTLEEMKSVFPEADESMLSIFSAENAVAGREVYGGTGFGQVAAQIAFWNGEFAKSETEREK